MDDFSGQVCLINQDNEVYGTLAEHVKTVCKFVNTLLSCSLLPVPIWWLAWWQEGTAPAAQSDTMLIDVYSVSGKEITAFPNKTCFSGRAETKIPVQVNALKYCLVSESR